jgi:hypothetical protein
LSRAIGYSSSEFSVDLGEGLRLSESNGLLKEGFRPRTTQQAGPEAFIGQALSA